MNRSYSKLRHIQELNKNLDKKLIEEKVRGQVMETFEIKSEKSKLIDVLERQRLLEESLKYHKNLNFRYINEEEVETSDETDEELTDEDFLSDEFQEFLKIYFKQLNDKYGAPNTGQEGEGEYEEFPLSESNYKIGGLLNEQLVWPGQEGFVRAMRAAWKRAGTKWRKGFKKFLRLFDGNDKKSKSNELMKDVSNKFKKYKKLKKQKKSGKKMDPLEKIWLGKKAGSAIKIGRASWINFGKGKESARASFESDSDVFDMGNIMDPGENNVNFINYLNDDVLFKSLMSKASKSNWEKLKSDPEEINFAVGVLYEFNNTYPESKWTKVGVGLTQEEFTKEVESEPEVQKIPETKKSYPYQTESFPLDGDDNNLFQNNQYDESHAEKFKQKVVSLCAKIQEYMAELNPPAGEPKAYLKAGFLESSASRLRNGGIAEKMTFLELAEKRLETGKTIMLRELKAIGVHIDEKSMENFITDATATKSERNPEGNGDGSSGPNPPVGYGFVPKGNFKMTAVCNGTNPAGKYGGQIPNDGKCYIPDAGKMVARNECGEPKGKYVSNGTPPEYEKYKYVRGFVQIVFNDNLAPEPVKTPPKEDKKNKPNVTTVISKKYPVYFYSPGKDPFRIALPGIRIRWKKLWQKFKISVKPKDTYPEPKGKKRGGTDCEAFGGGFGG